MNKLTSYNFIFFPFLGFLSYGAHAELIGFTVSSSQVNEGDGSVVLTIERVLEDESFAPPVEVGFSSQNGSASGSNDFQAVSGTLNWLANDVGSRTIRIPIINDTAVEGAEDFSVNLTSCFINPIDNATPCGASTLALTNQVITIVDDDNAGNIGFSPTGYQINESDGTVNIIATRNNGQSGAVSVSFQTFDKTATADLDYQASSGTLSWADQESGTKSITIPVFTDILEESSETFDIQLSNATNGASLQNDIAQVTINDSTEQGSLTLETATTVTVNEGETTEITVTRQNGFDGELTINYLTENDSAIAGQDYISTSGTLSWANQEQGSKSVSIATITDASSEANETFKVRFESPSDGSALLNDIVTVSIIDGISPGSITLSKSSVTIAEDSFLVIDVLRQGGADGDVSVNYATSDISEQVSGDPAVAGIDYTPVSGILVWTQGDSTAKTVRIPIANDFVNEGSEAFLFTLSNSEGAVLGNTPQMTITIDNKQTTLLDLPGLSPAQRKMAQMLEESCIEANGELLNRCNEILSGDFTEVELQEILQQLLPNEISSMGSTVVKIGSAQINNLMSRLSTLRRGQRGSSLDGLTLNVKGESLPVGKMLTSFSQPLGGGASSDILADEKFGFFVHGKVNVGDRDQSAKETGFEFNTLGVTAGMDYYFNDALVMGAAFGYGHTDTKYDQSKGEMNTNAIVAAFYGSYYFPQSFYIDWVMAYGFHDHEIDRNIRYSNADYVASSTPEGNQYDVALNFGKDFNWKQWLLNSYLRMEYQVIDIESYQETGGHGFALKVGEQTVNSVTSTLGGQLIYNWSQSWGVLSPGARFEWEHQYMDSSRNINTSFVNSTANGGTLSLATDKTDRNYFNLGASLSATFSHGRSAFILYETRLGQQYISSHTVELGVRIPF